MRKSPLLVVCLLLQLSPGAFAQVSEVNLDELTESPQDRIDLEYWRYQTGNSLEWRSPAFDDRHWQSIFLGELSEARPVANYWLRHRIVISGDDEGKSLAFGYTGINSASTVYIDGFKVHSEGAVGDSLEAEVAGIVNPWFRIPQDLSRPGEHIIAIRASNHNRILDYNKLLFRPAAHVVLYDTYLDSMRDGQMSSAVIVSVFLTITLFCLILFFGVIKSRAYLYLGLFCLAHSVSSLTAMYAGGPGISVPNMSLVTTVVGVAFYLSGLFLITFLLNIFSVSLSRRWLFGFAILASPVMLFTNLVAFYLYAYIGLGILICAFAAWKHRDEALFGTFGLAGFLIVYWMDPRQILDTWLVGGYTLGLLLFITSMTLLIGKRLARRNQQRQEAILRSSRLENLLLKKNISPHFVMNSLTSLQELVEVSPARASGFVEALANEFDVFASISGEQLISIEDEIALCRAHLKIMSYRKDSEFTLTTEGIDGTEQVPPAIFHTLAENGITHGYASKKKGHFILSKEQSAAGIRYSLFNDGEIDEGRAARPPSVGAGLNYVKMRLQESWPDAWELHAGAADNGWRVDIDVDHRRTPA